MTGPTRTALMASALVAAMSGLGYASVPLYRLFCEYTGLDGTTQRSERQSAPGAVAGRTIDIRFDANHVNSLPWTFKAEQNLETVTIGEREIAFYGARNLTNKPVTGSASYNVTPVQAGKYFSKIDCFCFKEQTLKGGEAVRMPVIFYVDPAILADPDTRDIKSITLSYTFYPVDEPTKPS